MLISLEEWNEFEADVGGELIFLTDSAETTLPTSRQIDQYRLLQILDERFDEEELRSFTFALRVDYDNLPADGKVNKARELIKRLHRHDRIYELIEIGKQIRPDVSWDAVYQSSAKSL